MSTQDNKAMDRMVMRGSIWLFSLRISTRLLGFVRSIILARLLTPADFGLVGMAMIVIAVLDIVTQTGFDATLIQKKDPPRRLIDTAWTLQVMRGALLFLIAFFIAPGAALFFQISSLELIIRLIAVSLIVTGLRNIGTVFFQKELKFDKTFQMEIVSSLVDLLVSVGLAFLLKNVWALVWGGLAGNITRLFMSYLLHPYRPHFFLAPDSLKTILHFGKWIMTAGIVYAIQVQVDTFTIGKVLGAREVGLYQMAMTLATIATTEISYLLRQVTFPTYSRWQHDMDRIKSAYRQVFALVSVICFPLGVILLTLTEDLVFVLFGPQWMAIVSCLRVLVISGVLATLGRLAYPLFLGLGRPKYETIFQGINLMIIIILIFPLTRLYGIIGAAGTLAMGNLIVLGLSINAIYRWGGFPPRLHLEILLLPLISAVIMAAVIFLILPYTEKCPALARLIVGTGTGIIVYAAVLYYLEKKTGREMIKPIVNIMRRAF
ncbi:MAG TPA: lipopolysaccharide biosynthesis protein [Syntrophales bacterium]|nr:lipopolysaccharide biosynthesis protein [Syntrophales bacterium]HOL60187.1 lipopolysaccharide biosynthesis protein [Syntrophales bacterium]HPO36311.1 lipopolysaccharide biosynthesis protein [Syntrophales bacterium]